MLIAWKNIMARKWSSTKVALSILAMVIIMCIFTAYSIALGEETERITKSYRSAHNVIIETTTPIDSKKVEQAKNIEGIGNVAEILVCRNTKNLRGMSFVIGGKEYSCNHDYYDGNLQIGIDEYENKMHTGDFAFVNEGEVIVQSHHQEELEYRFEDNDCLLAGTDKVSGNEIVVSEYFLQEFELGQDILNTNIIVKLAGKGYVVKVVGILNSHFFELTDTFEQHFIACKDSEIYNSYFSKEFGNSKYFTKLYLKEVKLNDKLLDDVKDLHIFSAKIKLGSQYGLSMSTTVRIIASILNGIMATVGLGIISALILNIVYSMRFMMKKKNNFYAIMQVYGMDKKMMFNIMFCEMLILSLLASIVAYGISYGLVYLLDYLLSSMVGIGVFFGWLNFLVTFIIAVVFTMCVVAIVCLINYSLYYKRSTSRMLRNTMEN